MNKKLLCAVVCSAMILGMAATVFAGGRHVQLFQSPIRDVNRAATNYVDFRGSYTTLDSGGDNSPTEIRGQAIVGVPVGDNFELNARGGFLNYDPDFEGADSESGLEDVEVAGRGHWSLNEDAAWSAGVAALLPVGKEEFRGVRDFAFAGFWAIHYEAGPKVRLTGAASVEYISYDTDTEVAAAPGLGGLANTGIEDSKTYLRIAPGLVYAASPELSIIGEISFPTDDLFPSILSGGVDYVVSDTGSLRGAVGIGINDAAAEFDIQAGYVMSFN